MATLLVLEKLTYNENNGLIAQNLYSIKNSDAYMRIFKEISLKLGGENKVIYFGMPTTQKEIDGIFKLRYEVYSKRGYTDKSLFPNQKERDEYDNTNKSSYFMAVIDNKIIGSARLIKDFFLPTEKCFKFKEPEEIKKIPREKRGEVSRLIVRSYSVQNKFLPSHLVLLGIIEDIFQFASEKDLRGGYSFIKKSLREKIEKLRMPFRFIEPFTQTYSQKHLWGYFNDPNDPVFPIYYLREEQEEYLAKIFNNKKIFQKINDGEYLKYILKEIKPYQILLHKLSRLFR